ncbi:hypothetical protein Bca101_059602 [Brassica carinata]
MNSRWHLGWRDRWKAVVVHRRKENCRSLMKNSPEKTRYFASPHKKKRLQSRSVRVKKSRKRNVSREDERLDDSKDGGAKKGRHEQVAEGFTAATKGPPALGKKAFGVVLILASEIYYDKLVKTSLEKVQTILNSKIRSNQRPFHPRDRITFHLTIYAVAITNFIIKLNHTLICKTKSVTVSRCQSPH